MCSTLRPSTDPMCWCLPALVADEELLLAQSVSQLSLFRRFALRKTYLFWIAVIAFMTMTAIAQSPSIQLDAGVFKVTGWRATAPPAKGWASVLAIYAGAGDVPALLG